MPEYTDAYGVDIVYDVTEAIGTARGVVQLAHGLGEHAGRYSALVQALSEAGFVVYADDHRGHGRTGMRQHHGDASLLGKLGVGGMPATVAALWQFTELIHAERPNLPLILIGHSWGSFLAQILLNDHPDAYDAVILSGSSLRWPGSLNASPLNKRWDGPGANGMEWLSRDPAISEGFVADPLTSTVPMLKLFGVRDTLHVLGRPKKDLAKNVPLLLMVGSEDPVGGPLSVHRLADAYRKRSGLTDLTTLVYPGARHEIFNEPEQVEVRAELLAWVDARFPSR